ncbi:PREDICTED: integrin alpha-7-like, partial [Pseudopodoces humilis]|uniref:integrin alpha-7-like n=1 Tax=Pseudopodoces humilis TaxID=181119 RepID=UPI0003957436
LAVGAPFDGAGKVFIYHGSALGIVTSPAQILDGEAVGVSAFGYSLSGGLDVDGNLYPDLLVGSLSDTVVLYSVEVRACFSYRGSPESYSPRLELRFVLEADSERRRRGLAPRGSFLGRGPADPEHRTSGTLELPRPRERRCVTATFRLHDAIRDKLRPVVLSLAFGLGGSRGSRGSRGAALPPLGPALSPRQPSTHRAEVHFLRQGCGDDKICQSHLELHPRFCARLGDSDFLCHLPRDEDGTAIFAMSDQKDVALEVLVTNEPSEPSEPQRDGDDAHQAVLVATLPPELPYAALRPDDSGGLGVRTSEQPGLEPVVARARVVFELPLAVTGVAVPPRLFFGGQVRGESAVKRESQVGSAVSFEVTVSQRGPVLRSPGAAALSVQWPLELPNGKWLLYPLSLEMGTPPVPCSPPANPLRLALEPPGRGDPPEEPPARSWWVPAARKRRNVTLDCARGTARCRPFRCPLPSLERSELRARGRLWNGTFLEEFLDVENLELIVRAEVSVASPRGNVVIKDAVAQMSLSLHLDPGVAVAAVPWWLLPLAALLGLLLLALLVLALWKLGFFRRARAPRAPAVPRFRAVRIPREQRPRAREGRTGTIRRPHWAAAATGTGTGDGDKDGPRTPGSA